MLVAIGQKIRKEFTNMAKPEFKKTKNSLYSENKVYGYNYKGC